MWMAAQLGSLLAAPQGGAGVGGTCLGWRLWWTLKYLEFYLLGIKRSKSRISLSSKERWTRDLPNTFTCDNQVLEQLKSLDGMLDLKGLNSNFKPCNWELNEWGKPKGTHVTDHAALGIILVQEWSSGHWWLNFNSQEISAGRCSSTLKLSPKSCGSPLLMLFVSMTLDAKKIILGEANAPAWCDSNVNVHIVVITLFSSQFGEWIFALRQRVQV